MTSSAEKEKPEDKYQHPDDIILLHDAETNMGDFKLKTASDYTVPEELRMNASKKRIQLVLLRQEIEYCSQLFNEKVIELRNDKVKLIERFVVCLERLKEIQLSLPREDQLFLPKMPTLRPEEVTERSLEFDEKEVDEIMMLKFGRKIDLEFFDPVEPSRNVLEMREQISQFEKRARQELNAKYSN